MFDFEPTPELTALLVKCGSQNYDEARAARHEFTQAITLPLRRGIMSGNILADIFEQTYFAPGIAVEYPLDFLAPGTEKDHVAYVVPKHGRINENHVEGDYLQVPIYEIGASIDTTTKYLRDGRWDVMGRMMAVLESMIIKKKNDDGFHALLAAAVDRNILVFDSDASAGQFTKRLVLLMQTTMRRNGGGNSTSSNRGKLTDLYLSPEALEDIRTWGVDQIDEVTRREIFTSANVMNRIYGVNLHDLDEFGEGQEYQDFFTTDLAASLQGSDVELVLGLDLENRDSFMMPVREKFQVVEDKTMERQRRVSFWGTEEIGFAVLDSRRAICGSF